MRLTPTRKIDKHGYELIESGDVFCIDPKKTLFQQACCGCNLVHQFDFKIERGKLFIKTVVDDKETKKLRKK
jgi:hypothetical protein